MADMEFQQPKGASPDRIQVTFVQTRDDIWEFTKFLQLQTPSLRFNLIVGCLQFPILSLAMGWVANVPIEVTVIITVLISGIGIPLYLWVWKDFSRKRPSEKGTELGTRTLSIAPDGVYEKTPVLEGLCHWQGILEIAENKDYIFMFTDSHRAFLIPKRAFSGSNDAQAFMKLAHSYRSGTKDVSQQV